MGTLASRQRDEESGRGNSPAVRSGRLVNVSEPPARGGIRKENSPAVRSGRQADISEPAVRQGIREGELTSCQIRPPGEY